ncbi:methyltransferase domain-containing protein [uncultured Sphaerochaeta sp.]|uniref:class I SAM-dependent methyltransferase n=1 Tax=uncultured Sphaerochaeta sp. TaxID=886478 RepID=UPI002A0A2D9A|nr:methyltransferase domain-containing protein [uncultured Sphaerochaeta sp.]
MSNAASYYDANTEQFLQSTLVVDMTEQYNFFLSHLPSGSTLLDAGCGSGRDSLAFTQMGYAVEAFDLSKAMVEATKRLVAIPVRQMGFSDLDYLDHFDGIWASASLLHVPQNEMSATFTLLSKALKPSGILFCSFKDREQDFSKEGRSFTCFTVPAFQKFVQQQGQFELLEILQTTDSRSDRAGEKWINAVLRKR